MGAANLSVEPWAIVEDGIDLDNLAQSESLFALSNGHLGLRGNFDEGEPRGLSGTYLNGFYESYPLEYGERGYGFAEDGQTVINVVDGKLIRLLVEDEPLDMHRGNVEFHRRRLDFRSGILEREVRWRGASGHAVKITTKRLVSLYLRGVAAISYEVEALEQPVRIALQSNLQANQPTIGESGDPRQARGLSNVLRSVLHRDHGLRVVLGHETRRSALTMAAGMDHKIEHDGEVSTLTQSEPDLGRVTISAQLKPGRPLKLTKFIAYHWSSQQSVDWLRDQTDASLESALAEGFDQLAAEQRRALDTFWERADVEVDGDARLQQAIRFALFHLYQMSARGEGQPIGAKGLSGTGYDGHAFWDTEMFVHPVLTFCAPGAVRAALQWRHSILDSARERALQLGLKGAAMPWRTIHGEECSGYWPAGTAAFHVNAAVADAVNRYVRFTGDEKFEADMGCELLVESARLWASLGYHDEYGDFRIDGVTGPDEYTALVDNNVYTNLMAQRNLWNAQAACERHPNVAEALGVTQAEQSAWKLAGDSMFIPYDEERGVHPQDQDFLAHERWDFKGTQPEEYPLLLNFPYMQLYRKQVAKQADLTLAMHWCGDAFTEAQKLANFDLYEEITVRDSSLSACTQSVVAADVGHLDLAEDYLYEAAFVDLDDLAGNTGDGLHMASLAGSVMAMTNGFGGMRASATADHLTFRPRLPEGIPGLRFSTLVRDTLLRVEIAGGEVTYRLPHGGTMEIEHWGELIVLDGDSPHTLQIPATEETKPPKQPYGREPGVPRARSEAAGHRQQRVSGAGRLNGGLLAEEEPLQTS